MKFKIENTNDMILIASTRPELLFACQAVIVNPKDDRFFAIHGKRAILPLFGRSIPILTHHSAKPEFGTGALMVCSYGDQNDVQVFRDLKLEEIRNKLNVGSRIWIIRKRQRNLIRILIDLILTPVSDEHAKFAFSHSGVDSVPRRNQLVKP